MVIRVSKREAQSLGEAHQIDGVADARALHQQHRALAAEPGAGSQRHAFFSVVSVTVCMALDVWQDSISRPWPASGT